MNREDYLREYLKIFWLRPENALLCAFRAEKYRSTIPDGFGDLRSWDVSCGDGLFSFIALGGRVTLESDMFRGVRTDRERTGSFDTFDHFDESYRIGVEARPTAAYSLGTDWKANLLKKAGVLDWYGALRVHDNEEPLPFDAESFDYLYSNSAYWVSAFEAHVREMVRVTRPGGRVVFEMKTDAMRDVTAAAYAPFLGARAHEILDAGRLDTWRGLRSRDDLQAFFDGLDGIEVERFEPIYGGLPLQIWDVGLRPLYRPLLWMANEAPPETRTRAKEEWIRVLHDLGRAWIASYEPDPSTAAEWLIQLRRV